MSNLLLRSLIAALCLVLACFATLPASATEPLKDQIVVGSLKGHLFPSDCCWVPLPPSERLRAMKRAEFPGCTAIGGPVGMFELKDRKLWLTGLYKCSGALDHREVFPELASPAFAGWLSGSFTLALGPCGYDPRAQLHAYERRQRITVEKGVVTSVTELDDSAASCPGTPPGP